MMRVASARPIGPESGNIIWSDNKVTTASLDSGLQNVSATNIQFSLVKEALRTVEFRAPQRDEREEKKVIKMMATHDSLEHFMTRPLLSQGSLLGLTIPMPFSHVKMSPLEKRLYEVLAVRYLYPEVRFIHALSQRMANKMASDGFLISRQRRVSAQEVCFEAKNYTEKCLYENALRPVIKEIVEEVNREYEGDLSSGAIYEQTLALIEKGGASSVVYWEAYSIEAAESYEMSKSLGELLISCVNYPRRFFSWQLIGIGRCDRAIKDELVQSGVRSEVVIDTIVKNVVMNSFSPLQKALVSLSEDILNRGVFCFSDDCIERKVLSRVNEWSFASELSSEERKRLSKAIATWWVE